MTSFLRGTPHICPHILNKIKGDDTNYTHLINPCGFSRNITAYKLDHYCCVWKLFPQSESAVSSCNTGLLSFTIISPAQNNSPKKAIKVLCSSKPFLSSNPNNNGELKCTFIPVVPRKTASTTVKLRATHVQIRWCLKTAFHQ